MNRIIRRIYSLSGRERSLLLGAVALIIIFLFVQFVVFPIYERRNTFLEKTELLEERFNLMKQLAERYNQVNQEYLAIRKRITNKESTPVLTYIDNLATGEGLRDSIDYIKPRGEKKEGELIGSIVEIKIDAIEPQKLIKFMNDLESKRKGLVITSVRLKPYFKEKGKFDLIMQVTDYNLSH